MIRNSATKNVLIVDDERSFLLSLIEGLQTFADDFTTFTATNGKIAVEVLKSTKIDLVVTDLKMPEMDGFQLLAYMSRNHPGIPVIVMSAYCTPEIKSRIEGISRSKILEKPLDYHDLVDSIFDELTGTSSGFIEGISLPAFLQLVEMEKKTCTLTIKSEGRKGFLYFLEGVLVDAETRTSQNEQAAHEIVCWDDPEIEIASICRKKARHISATLGHILMEGFYLKDQKERAEGLGDKDPGRTAPADAVSEDLKGASPSLQQEGRKENAPSLRAEKEEKMATAQEILKEFSRLQGVDAVCLVGRDGFLLDSMARTGIDAEMIGAIASSGFGSAESIGRQLGKGEMTISMIEFERGPVMFSPTGRDAFVVIIADKEANLGMVRLKLKKHSSELAVAAAI